MRYEIMFITYPSGEIFERAKKKLIDIIELFNGNVISINDWGNKRLACTMQGFDIGRYGLLTRNMKTASQQPSSSQYPQEAQVCSVI